MPEPTPDEVAMALRQLEPLPVPQGGLQGPLAAAGRPTARGASAQRHHAARLSPDRLGLMMRAMQAIGSAPPATAPLAPLSPARVI